MGTETNKFNERYTKNDSLKSQIHSYAEGQTNYHWDHGDIIAHSFWGIVEAFSRGKPRGLKMNMDLVNKLKQHTKSEIPKEQILEANSEEYAFSRFLRYRDEIDAGFRVTFIDYFRLEHKVLSGFFSKYEQKAA